MEIITAHTNTDFDGLASMIAAQKLYPDAFIVFPGKVSRNVKEFLALHKDEFNIKPIKFVDFDKITKLIIVDTHNPKRVGAFAKLCDNPDVEIHIYDHHPAAECYLSSAYLSKGKKFVHVVEPVGAAATILVERIRERGISINSLEATAIALGIYSDTGCMLFSSTTARDVEAVKYLLDKGANLGVLSDFLNRALLPEQQELLKKLLNSVESHDINGIKIVIASAVLDEFIDGLALMTHKLSEFERNDAIFTVVFMEDRVHIVARSSTPAVNCRDILHHFGGGGHNAAASASIKGVELNETVKRLLNVISTHVHAPLAVKDIMSFPVKTAFPETTVEEANKIMLRYGHTGLPVVKGLKLVGMISKRDVEKAVHHNLGHAPVKAYMNVNVHTVTPDTPVSKVRDIMIAFDIGRLPVVKDDRIVGIVSRRDILRCMHTDLEDRHFTLFNTKGKTEICFKDKLIKALPEELISILHAASRVADKCGYKVYICGGIVRDIILGVKNLDIDLILEGEIIEFANAFAKEINAKKVNIHEKFGTAEVVLSDDFWIDVATARVEFYEYPAALPDVEKSSIKFDLYRRDFTINALAVSLNKGDMFKIIDYFGGFEDLEAGIIRVLHNLSFVEDPTRILRAVRFEQRYDMQMEPQTLRFLKDAVSKKLLLKLSDDRIWHELKIILSEPKALNMLQRLFELGAWDQVFPNVSYEAIKKVLDKINECIKLLNEWGWQQQEEKWFLYFMAVVHHISLEHAKAACHKYSLSAKQIKKVEKTIENLNEVLRKLTTNSELKISEIYECIKDFPKEAYPLLLAKLDDRKALEMLKLTINKMNSCALYMSGDDIEDMGVRPGPIYKEVLNAVYKAKLDGKVNSKEEELDFAEKYIKKIGFN